MGPICDGFPIKKTLVSNWNLTVLIFLKLFKACKALQNYLGGFLLILLKNCHHHNYDQDKKCINTTKIPVITISCPQIKGLDIVCSAAGHLSQLMMEIVMSVIRRSLNDAMEIRRFRNPGHWLGLWLWWQMCRQRIEWWQWWQLGHLVVEEGSPHSDSAGCV